MKNSNKHPRKADASQPALRRKKSTTVLDLRGKQVSVRSVSGLSYPVRGRLGRELAEERS
jgi:hypothetical protein